MRLCFFGFVINFGGAPQAAVYLAERLSKSNEVHIIDAYGCCELYIDAVKKARLPYRVLMPVSKATYIGRKGIKRLVAFLKQLPTLLRLRSRLIKEILAIDPDVIWVMNKKPLTFLATSFRLRRYLVALYVQGWGTPDQVSLWFRWLMKHRVAAIPVVSTATMEQLRIAGVPERKLHLASNTVDFEEVQRQAKVPLEEALPGMGMSPKILLLAARPTRAKGHSTAFRAVARLKQAGYNPALWIPGKVAAGVGDNFIDELKSLAIELDIEKNVFFLGWRKNMPALINACDIGILPSHTEGFPLVNLEAMLLCRPIVATPVGGVGDTIKDGQTGFLFPVDDDRALAERIQWLMTEPGRREQIVSRAYEYVQSNFSPEGHTYRITEIFRSIARERP
jgi:glycosyltransferase involved in cell wall biosynthesis